MDERSIKAGTDSGLSAEDSERMRNQIFDASAEYTMYYTVERPALGAAALGYGLHELGEDIFSAPKAE